MNKGLESIVDCLDFLSKPKTLSWYNSGISKISILGSSPVFESENEGFLVWLWLIETLVCLTAELFFG